MQTQKHNHMFFLAVTMASCCSTRKTFAKPAFLILTSFKTPSIASLFFLLCFARSKFRMCVAAQRIVGSFNIYNTCITETWVFTVKNHT